jgi:hypothetical protein
MSDSSPIFQRKPRRKAPKIMTSQDSPMQPPSKRNVPPSPGVIDLEVVLFACQRAASLSKSQSSSASQQGIVPLAIDSDAPAALPGAVPSDAPAAPPVAVPSDAPAAPPVAVPSDAPAVPPVAVPSDALAAPSLAVPLNPKKPDPKPKKARKRHVSQQGIVPLAVSSGAPNPKPDPKPKPKKVSRRQRLLQNPLLALQAVECDLDGASVEGSENSKDDMLV